MYTNGKIIIEKKNYTIKVITGRTEFIYTLESEEEAFKVFITFILENERNKKLP